MRIPVFACVCRVTVALFAVAILSAPSLAQRAGGDTGGDTGGAAAVGGVAQTTGGGTATSDTAATADFFNADDAFSNVQRGSGIGTAANTIGTRDDAGGAAGGARGGLGGLGGFGGGGLGALGQLFGGFGAGTSQSTKPVIRTRLRSAITGVAMPPARVQRTANRRIQTLSNQPQLRGVRVEMQGRKAVMTGTVGSTRDRRMSEMLIRLEPGVSQIDNQLVVQPQP